MNSTGEDFTIEEEIIDITDGKTESNSVDSILNEISELKNFQSNVEKKLFELEKVLLSQQVHR